MADESAPAAGLAASESLVDAPAEAGVGFAGPAAVEPAADAGALAFAGPAADSRLGELLIDAIGVVCASGHALELHRARFLCGATFREGARRADGSLDRAGFKGGTADMIAASLRRQAPWLPAARARPCESERVTEPYYHFTLSGITQLMRATQAGNERRVRELVAAGAPVGLANKTSSKIMGGEAGLTALHFATSAGVVDALLNAGDAAGALLEARSSHHVTPLMAASRRGRAAVVRALVARGARLDASGFGGHTAMHLAVEGNHAAALAELCAAPDAAAAMEISTDIEEDIQLQLSCPNGPVAIPGKTPLELASSLRRHECEAVLRKAMGGGKKA